MAWFRCTGGNSGGGGTYNRYEIDNSTLISGIYIDENNGTERTENTWSATDFLEVDGNSLVFMGNILNYSVNIYNAFYDENKNYVARLTIPNPFRQEGFEPIAIPSNAKYMRISCQTALFTTNSYFMGTDN